jgi:glycosyltransferase involved in cell wall biosynthesis
MSLVSVIVPVYNGEDTIAQTIDSALAQDFADFEVVVVDDGSTDSSATIVGRYGKRIRTVRQQNFGAAAARNLGASIATGEYLAFLDADDTWARDKLQLTHRALEKNRGAVLAFSGYRRISPDGTETLPFFYGKAPSLPDIFRRRIDIPPSTVLMRRWVFERCGGFYQGFRPNYFEDTYLWMLAREQGEFAYVNHALVSYRLRRSYCEERVFTNARIFERLVRARYGSSAIPVLRQNRRDLANLAMDGAVTCMNGDARSAIAWWIRAVRLRPWVALRRTFRLRSAVYRKLRRVFAFYGGA